MNSPTGIEMIVKSYEVQNINIQTVNDIKKGIKNNKEEYGFEYNNKHIYPTINTELTQRSINCIGKYCNLKTIFLFRKSDKKATGEFLGERNN